MTSALVLHGGEEHFRRNRIADKLARMGATPKKVLHATTAALPDLDLFDVVVVVADNVTAGEQEKITRAARNADKPLFILSHQTSTIGWQALAGYVKRAPTTPERPSSAIVPRAATVTLLPAPASSVPPAPPTILDPPKPAPISDDEWGHVLDDAMRERDGAREEALVLRHEANELRRERDAARLVVTEQAGALKQAKAEIARMAEEGETWANPPAPVLPRPALMALLGAVAHGVMAVEDAAARLCAGASTTAARALILPPPPAPTSAAARVPWDTETVAYNQRGASRVAPPAPPRALPVMRAAPLATAVAGSVEAKVRAVFAAHPKGVKQQRVIELVGGAYGTIFEVLKSLKASGALVQVPGQKSTRGCLWIMSTPTTTARPSSKPPQQPAVIASDVASAAQPAVRAALIAYVRDQVRAGRQPSRREVITRMAVGTLADRAHAFAVLRLRGTIVHPPGGHKRYVLAAPPAAGGRK